MWKVCWFRTSWCHFCQGAEIAAKWSHFQQWCRALHRAEQLSMPEIQSFDSQHLQIQYDLWGCVVSSSVPRQGTCWNLPRNSQEGQTCQAQKDQTGAAPLLNTSFQSAPRLGGFFRRGNIDPLCHSTCR